jgi:DNA-binding beta-propeller fold protein YncE
MKSSFRALWLLFGTAVLVMLAVGCNDTLRQFIVPIPSPTGNPQALEHAIILSTNPDASASGSNMHIDVSGDSNVGVVPLGLNPVFLGKTTSNVFVINSGNPNATPSSPQIPPTVSIYTALLPQSAIVSTVTLPTTGPDAVQTPVAGATSSVGNIYIANRDSDNVSVISGSVFSVIDTIQLPAGSHPVMIAGNSANNKIFVVDQGTSDVTEISTIDNTIVKTIPVGLQPIWGVMSTDGLFAFIVNQGDGTVTVIDASLDIVLPCDPSTASCQADRSGLPHQSIKVGASPNFAFYEPQLRRVYVSNTGENTVSVIKGNGFDLGSVPQVLPFKLADVALSGAPTSVTALSDGTKAYAALGGCPAGVNHTTLLSILATPTNCNGNKISVIDAVSLQEAKTITVGIGPVSIDASANALRVYSVNAHDSVTNATGTHAVGTISDINTSTDTEVMRELPPQQDPTCAVSATVFCPLQSPFMVRTFP